MKHLEDKKNYNFFMKLIQDYDSFVLVVETNTSGIIEYVSRGFCSICGFSKDELIGQKYNIFDNIVEQKQIVILNNTKDDNIYYLDVSVVEIYEDNILKGYRFLSKDVTEHKNLEKLAKNLEKKHQIMLNKNFDIVQQSEILLQKKDDKINSLGNDILSIFTHELKTPLNAIINFSDYLERNLKKELTCQKIEKLSIIANKIKQNGENQNAMLQSILELADFQSNIMKISISEVNLATLIEQLVYNNKLTNTKIVNVNIIQDLSIFMDKKLFSTIFNHLYSNALKYAKTTVLITAIGTKDGKFEFCVEDDGDGVAKENRTKIFNLFEQTDSCMLRRESTGLGIGLYTVSLIAQSCQHKIIVDKSLSLGGAKFILTGKIKNKEEVC